MAEIPTRKDVIKAWWKLPRDSREKIWREHGIGYNPKTLRVEQIHDRSKSGNGNKEIN